MQLSFKFLYSVVMLLVICTDIAFMQLFKGLSIERMMIFLSFPLAFLFWNEFSRLMRYWFILISIYLAFLVIESYYQYYTLFIYPHVFGKILVYYLLFFVYGFYKKFPKSPLYVSVLIALSLFMLNALLINRHALSLSSFSETERGLYCSTTYLLLFCLLFFFNNYFYSKKTYNIYGFFLCLALIIFLQHRTVWVSTFFALVINVLIFRRAAYKFSLNSLTPVFIFVTFVGVFMSAFIFSNDKILKKINDNVNQILNPIEADNDETSTSRWRYQQAVAYWPFVEENFILGLRFKGFELPVQNYGEDREVEFDDNTGHHFHSFYLDKLYYNGLLGLLLCTLPLLYILFVSFFAHRQLNYEQIALFCFSLSTFVYGISYDLDTFAYGIVGYTIYKMEEG